MGKANSKHVYAFNPLPWPQAFEAFRLIDQICGVATTFASQGLGNHSFKVLDRVAQLQRLPHQWDVFEADIPKLRGQHLMKLATELHKALEQLEGIKYDIADLAERGLAWKSQRKASEQVLALLDQTEAVHSAFFYQFELALYSSLRDSPEATEIVVVEGPEPRVSNASSAPAPVRTVQHLRSLQPPPQQQQQQLHSVQYQELRGTASAPPPPLLRTPKTPAAAPVDATAAAYSPAPEAPRHMSKAAGRSAVAVQVGTPTVRATRQQSPPPSPPMPQQRSQQPRQQYISPPRREASLVQQQQPRGRASNGGDGASARPRAQSDQYVLVYLPQGPGNEGPRTMLLRAGTMQPLPVVAGRTGVGPLEPSGAGSGGASSSMWPRATASPVSQLQQQLASLGLGQGEATSGGMSPIQAVASALAAAGGGARSGGDGSGGGNPMRGMGDLRSSPGGGMPGIQGGGMGHASYSPSLQPRAATPTASPTSTLLRSAAGGMPTLLLNQPQQQQLGWATMPGAAPRGLVTQQMAVHTTPSGAVLLLPQQQLPHMQMLQHLQPQVQVLQPQVQVQQPTVITASPTMQGQQPVMYLGYSSSPNLGAAGSPASPVYAPASYSLSGSGGPPLYTAATAAAAPKPDPGRSGSATPPWHSTVTYVPGASSPQQQQQRGPSSGLFGLPQFLSSTPASDPPSPEYFASFGMAPGGAAKAPPRVGPSEDELRDATDPWVTTASVLADRAIDANMHRQDAEQHGALTFERLAAVAGVPLPPCPAPAPAPRESGSGTNSLYEAAHRASNSNNNSGSSRGAAGQSPLAQQQQHPLAMLGRLAPPQRLGEQALARAEGLLAAAEGGEASAVVELAMMIRKGWWGDERDPQIARALLQQAAATGGRGDALLALGEMAERGEGLAGGPDLRAAAQHYAAASTRGSREATTALGHMMEHGRGMPRDEARAAQLYASAANRGCPTASNNLAKMMLAGRGGLVLQQQPGGAGSAGGAAAMAVALFRRAADAGSATAWYNLGICYLQGGGGGGGSGAERLPRDEHEALRCLWQAAAKGHARAALRAGHLHVVRREPGRAVEAFSTAVLNATKAVAPGGDGGGTDAPGGLGMRAVEGEARWCIAQLAERQAALLSERGNAMATAAAGVGAKQHIPGTQHDTADATVGTGGVSDLEEDTPAAAAAGQSGSGAQLSEFLAAMAAGQGVATGDDERDGVAAAVAAFEVELCRIDFGMLFAGASAMDAAAVLRGAMSPPGGGGNGPAAAAAARRGLKLLRREGRKAAAASASPADPAADYLVRPPSSGGESGSLGAAGADGDSASVRSSTAGGGAEGSGGGGGMRGPSRAVADALARLDLQLAAPEERAARARKAATTLMEQAAGCGYGPAQHWLGQRYWALGQLATAAACWETAGQNGHTASLMTLGQLAESGQLPAAPASSGKAPGGSSGARAMGGADLSTAARYYLRAQEAGAPEAAGAMRRVQGLLARHADLQRRLQPAVAAAMTAASRLPVFAPAATITQWA